MAGNLLEERIPPQAVDAEMAVLGSMLLDAESADSIFEILKAEHFYKEAHQKIFAVLQDMADKNQPLDLVTLTEALRRKKLLTQVGGEVYLAMRVPMRKLCIKKPWCANSSAPLRPWYNTAITRSMRTRNCLLTMRPIPFTA